MEKSQLADLLRNSRGKNKCNVVRWREWMYANEESIDAAITWEGLERYVASKGGSKRNSMAKHDVTAVRQLVIIAAIERGMLPPEALEASYPNGRVPNQSVGNRSPELKPLMNLLTNTPAKVAAKLLSIDYDQLLAYVRKEDSPPAELLALAAKVNGMVLSKTIDQRLLYPDDKKVLLWTVQSQFQ